MIAQTDSFFKIFRPRTSGCFYCNFSTKKDSLTSEPISQRFVIIQTFYNLGALKKAGAKAPAELVIRIGNGIYAESALNCLVRREILREAVFLWTTPLLAARIISGSTALSAD